MTESTDDAVRYDPEVKARIRGNLFQKADEAEKIRRVLATVSEIVSGPLWEEKEVEFSRRVRCQLFSLLSSLPDPEELRERADNDTYLGNCAVFGRDC